MLRQIGELTVERKRLDQREGSVQASIAAAEQTVQQTEQKQQQIGEHLAGLAEREKQLAAREASAADSLREFQSQIERQQDYLAKLQSMVETADAARSLLPAEESNVETQELNAVKTDLEALVAAAREQEAQLRSQADAAALELEHAKKRVALFQLRLPN